MVAWPAYRNHDKNPYNHLLYGAMTDRSIRVREATPRSILTRAAVLHVHWPEDLGESGGLRSARRLGLLLAAITYQRLVGAKVIWTAHNADSHSHESGIWQRIYWRIAPFLFTDIIHLSEAGRSVLLESKPGFQRPVLRHHIVPHGPYPVRRRTQDVRLGDRTALILGQVRAYKKIDEFVDVWNIARPDGWQLLVAGECAEQDLRARLVARASASKQVSLILRWLSEQEIEDLLMSASLVVITGPRHNSGVLWLGLSAARPVLAPDSMVFREAAATVGTPWIVPYVQVGDTRQDAASLNRALHQVDASSSERLGVPEIPSWAEIAARTVAIYREI